jgi:hypothetical protein
MGYVCMVMLPPQHDALEHHEQDEQHGSHTNQHLNWIKERSHDEGNEEEPIHQQQRHTAVVADHFAPVPAQKSEHVDLLQATRVVVPGHFAVTPIPNNTPAPSESVGATLCYSSSGSSGVANVPFAFFIK